MVLQAALFTADAAAHRARAGGCEPVDNDACVETLAAEPEACRTEFCWDCRNAGMCDMLCEIDCDFLSGDAMAATKFVFPLAFTLCGLTVLAFSAMVCTLALSLAATRSERLQVMTSSPPSNDDVITLTVVPACSAGCQSPAPTRRTACPRRASCCRGPRRCAGG